MKTSAYFIGRNPGTLQLPFQGTDQIYGSQRLDGTAINAATYEHCTFANISFKDAKFENGRFLNCVFIACFFRNAEVQSCNFSSCRFIDCEFPRTSFLCCEFRYTRFADCHIPFDEIEHNLPTEPNLREQITHNLAHEAAMSGDPANARAYRLCEIKARESNCWAAIMGKSKWYKDHYDVAARIGIAFRLVGSLLNRVLFGYGERLRVLIQNYLIATFVIFPIIFYFIPGGLSLSSPWAALEFSLSNAVAGALHSSIEAGSFFIRLLSATQIVLSVVWASLVGSYVFRWSLQR